jgi:hypothetical protein
MSYSIELPTYGRVNQDIIHFMFQNLMLPNCIDIQKIYYLQFFSELFSEDKTYLIQYNNHSIWQGFLEIARNEYRDELSNFVNRDFREEPTNDQYIEWFIWKAEESDITMTKDDFLINGCLNSDEYIDFLIRKNLIFILPSIMIYIR